MYLVTLVDILIAILLTELRAQDVPKVVHSLLHCLVHGAQLLAPRGLILDIVALPAQIVVIVDNLPTRLLGSRLRSSIATALQLDHLIGLDLVADFEGGVLAIGYLKKATV